MRNRTFWPIKT